MDKKEYFIFLQRESCCSYSFIRDMLYIGMCVAIKLLLFLLMRQKIVKEFPFQFKT